MNIVQCVVIYRFNAKKSEQELTKNKQQNRYIENGEKSESVKKIVFQLHFFSFRFGCLFSIFFSPCFIIIYLFFVLRKKNRRYKTEFPLDEYSFRQDYAIFSHHFFPKRSSNALHQTNAQKLLLSRFIFLLKTKKNRQEEIKCRIAMRAANVPVPSTQCIRMYIILYR